ncbi:MAG: aminopeptidase N [Porticoccaceae bacterium]
MTVRDATPQTIYLKDYQVPEFLIDKTNLVFDLHEQFCRVTSALSIRRNPESQKNSAPLFLHGGIELDLQQLKIDDQIVAEKDYQRTVEGLVINQLPDSCVIEIEVLIRPHINTTMMGLYKSRTMYCTQCEAEGFRNITFYLDRPDIMSEFTTKLIADKQQFPVLLSNGNAIEQGELESGRHFATWHDPFKKPAYLFALVAGDLRVVEDSFTTCSNREILLQIYVEQKDLNKCDHAMLSLKNSMRWDEQVYGREYDLDRFMIVAVDDFNMGAMENKGLNIFNTSAVLANPKTTTDLAFQRVEGIVAHEYFHNWSGNRVTCRDWFQLSLKEGFTVYRDSQFSADMNSAVVKRIEDVVYLRTHQFAEDAGPMSHPVQPDAYMEINNFYTLTVYEKGAEVVGMIHSLLGDQKFREGSDLYFTRYDGQAVTIEEFVGSMEEVSGLDLMQFRRWYKQSGTPQVDVKSHYDAAAKTFSLSFTQSCPPTPGQNHKEPFYIPIKLGLVGADGQDLPLNSQGDQSIVFSLYERSQTLVFENIQQPPVPSLLRGFSAPIKLNFDYSNDELAHLMANDSDGFNRWDAGQKLSLNVLNRLIDDAKAERELVMDQQLIEVFDSLLSDHSLDPAMVNLMLQLPSEAQLHEQAEIIYVEPIHRAREFVRQAVANALQEKLVATYERLTVTQDYAPEAGQIGNRALRNCVLSYLMQVESVGPELAWQQFNTADNMTDKAAALGSLVNCKAAELYSYRALKAFETDYSDETLAMNLWLQIQASAKLINGLDRVKALMAHPAFNINNPNKARSLLGAFCSSNLINFHRPDGSGYRFLQQQVTALNALNPQVAARLVTPLTRWKKLPEPNRGLMRDSLQKIAEHEGLVKDIQEIVTKSL